MAVPKRKTSRSNTRHRRSQWKAVAPSLVTCANPSCGAKHLPLAELAERTGEIDKDRPVVLYCRGGNRSTMATDALADAGFDAVKLSEGIVGWDEADLPLEPEPRTGVGLCSGAHPPQPIVVSEQFVDRLGERLRILRLDEHASLLGQLLRNATDPRSDHGSTGGQCLEHRQRMVVGTRRVDVQVSRA